MLGKILMKVFWWLLSRDLLPDFILRWRIRGGLEQLVKEIEAQGASYENRVKIESDFVKEIKESPIAVHQQEANQQHYEVPPEFFRIVLGPKLKYSSCLYPTSSTTLADAELAMLDLYVERSGMKDGMTLLDLGCGWGSVALHFAQKFKNSKVFALSNSRLQKEYIDSFARDNNIKNLTVVTGDVAVFQSKEFVGNFDRVISIEMFEHMKNYEKLLGKICSWLRPGGKLFVHIFTHKWKPYHFEKDWMAKTFFTGGTMPSHSLLLNFQGDMALEDQWGVSGTHYSRTLEAWLEKMDNNMDIIQPILVNTYGTNWKRWHINWRLFFIVCSETFGMKDGSEWGVSHYLFTKK